ncbi:MAG: hypothetical protein HS103_07070 [Anaerolineales bacterium]|nr:hypothetical protein [Anaerolineales bacterium]
MARDTLPITDLAVNALTAPETPLAISPTDGATLPAGGDTGRIAVQITNSAEAAYTVTVAAGVNPPAFRAPMGDLAMEIPAGATRYLVIESARFAQANGAIWLDFESGMTGTALALRLPRGV